MEKFINYRKLLIKFIFCKGDLLNDIFNFHEREELIVLRQEAYDIHKNKERNGYFYNKKESAKG